MDAATTASLAASAAFVNSTLPRGLVALETVWKRAAANSGERTFP
jgi:hypothetical protein